MKWFVKRPRVQTNNWISILSYEVRKLLFIIEHHLFSTLCHPPKRLALCLVLKMCEAGLFYYDSFPPIETNVSKEIPLTIVAVGSFVCLKPFNF